MTYVQPEQLKATLEMSGFSYADEDIKAAVRSASRHVENHCNRTFVVPGANDAPTTRYYTPQTGEVILIDDLVELVTLETDQDGDGVFERSWTENTEFFLEPLNSAADGRPYTRLALNTYWPSQSFPSWSRRSVKLTGKFGWPLVPDEVPESVTILATRYLRRKREAPLGVVAVGVDGESVKLSKTDPDVASMLEDYVRELVS